MGKKQKKNINKVDLKSINIKDILDHIEENYNL